MLRVGAFTSSLLRLPLKVTGQEPESGISQLDKSTYSILTREWLKIIVQSEVRAPDWNGYGKGHAKEKVSVSLWSKIDSLSIS